MHLRLLFILFLVLPLSGITADQKPIAINHVTVIDGTGAAAKPDMTVIVSGGRISNIEPSSATKTLAGVEEIDATGKFLIAGLWDMHAHLTH